MGFFLPQSLVVICVSRSLFAFMDAGSSLLLMVLIYPLWTGTLSSMCGINYPRVARKTASQQTIIYVESFSRPMSGG